MKKFLPGIRTSLLIGLAIFMAYAFIWQRITLQNLSSQIRSMEEDVRQLEKNRNYLKADFLYRSSLEQIKSRATLELGMLSSSDSDLVFYSDSLIGMLRSGQSPASDLKQLAVPLDSEELVPAAGQNGKINEN